MAELVNVTAAAKALAVSKFTIYKAVAKGTLIPYRFGRALRFDVDELRFWMRDQAKGQNENG